jgi:hypothetical protein
MAPRVSFVVVAFYLGCGRVGESAESGDTGANIDAPVGGEDVATVDSSAGTDVADGAIAVEAACRAMIERICSAWRTCDPLQFEDQYGSEALCMTEATKACVAEAGLPGASSYAEQTQACGDAMAADGRFTCRGFFRYQYEGFLGCRGKGTFPTTAGCLGGFQCASGVCRFRDLGCGKCADEVPLGGTCDRAASSACVLGTTCFTSTTTATTCTALVDEGGDCLRKPCHWDLVCLSNKCVARPDVGEACDPRRACLPGRVCDPSTNRCTLVTPLGPGEPCGFLDDSGVLRSCVHGYRCTKPEKFSPTATCVPATKLGEPCAADASPETACEPDLFCIGGSCLPPLDLKCP